jgi:hypothetical protein
VTKIHATASGILTCPDGHMHGNAIVRLTWDQTSPFEVDIEIESERRLFNGVGRVVTGIAERETLAQCALYDDVDDDGELYGTPGGVTFKIRNDDAETIIVAVPVTLSSGNRVGLMAAFERDEAARFIEQTYVVVPAGREDVDLDRLAARLLYS